MDSVIGKTSQRHSFILVLWTEAGPYPNSPPVWRISLEAPVTSVRWGFKCLAELIDFLEEWMSARQDTSRTGQAL